jgi:hypothetical protein
MSPRQGKRLDLTAINAMNALRTAALYWTGYTGFAAFYPPPIAFRVAWCQMAKQPDGSRPVPRPANVFRGVPVGSRPRASLSGMRTFGMAVHPCSQATSSHGTGV